MQAARGWSLTTPVIMMPPMASTDLDSLNHPPLPLHKLSKGTAFRCFGKQKITMPSENCMPDIALRRFWSVEVPPGVGSIPH
jgi:hypothetical protein